MKSWKNLFVKNNEAEKENPVQPQQGFSFPAAGASTQTDNHISMSSSSGVEQAIVNEVLSVYEKGIDSINMPGYDFYEFYKAISSISLASEQTYHMAFQMAKSMDANLTPLKLVKDAEFYISKINEVHNQYTQQGQQKINSLDTKKNDEKNKLNNEINQATQQVAQLRNQLQALESEINQKRLKLNSVDSEFMPQENSIRQKLLANDNARQISIMKLTTIKDGIQKYIK
jgi:hypothetical protein